MNAKDALKKTAQRLAQTLDTLADLRNAADSAAQVFEEQGRALPPEAQRVMDALDVVGPYVGRQLALAAGLLDAASDGSDDLPN